MRGGISPRAATVAEALRAHGYATYAAGKWPPAPMDECSAAGPHTNWPVQKGFDRLYGFLQGDAAPFSPALTSHHRPIDPPGRPDDRYPVTACTLRPAHRRHSDHPATPPPPTFP